MKNYLPPLLLLGLLITPVAAQTNAPTTNAPAVTPPPSSADNQQPLATAVLDFQSSDDLIEKQGADAATLLEADLSASENTIMVERQDINKILSEQELGASGVVSSETAAKIGSLTGAQVLVTGRIFATGNQFVLVAKVMSTETSRVYGVTTTLGSLSNLTQGVQDLSGKIDGVLASHRDVMVARQETPDQFLQRLRTLVGQRDLPTVSVKITERDYTQETIDPAAETEMAMLLQKLGFKVIDPDQTHKAAAIAITGEAFSEVGSFHGNLVSGRGRIEIKVTRGNSQELLLVDRETQIAVAVGARTAGKNALQKAADKLMDRILPKLTN
jgi:Curli production assembly/transport component CsgG